MNHYSSRALVGLSVPAILWYSPRRVRRMPGRYGDWTVEIAGISIEECRVEFDSKGTLIIDIPNSVQEDIIDKIRLLPRKSKSAFRTSVSRADLISAEFARCTHISFGPAPEKVGTFDDVQRGDRLVLQYETFSF